MTELTKWPRLLVVGEPVTREQANEILIRTCIPAYLLVNDRQWTAEVDRIMGFNGALDTDWSKIPELRDNTPARLAWLNDRWAALDARIKELGIFGGDYLYTSRIASNWLGGPHGWCDWDGTVFTDNYNIGKWPTVEAVTEEWEWIAQEFPFLDLTAQVITDEGSGELAAEWRVKDGEVRVSLNPVHQITCLRSEPENRAMLRQQMADILGGVPGRERGVSAERLAEAVAQVEQAMRERRER